MKTMLYAGTYTAKSSQGIYSFSFEDGRLSSSQLFCEIKNPKYLTKIDNCLITVADQIQDGAGCHQILVFHERILVPCLFLDRVFIFDRSLKKIGSIHFNANTGPRHGVFSKDGKYLYLVSELSNELFVIETNEWNIIHQIPVLMSKEIHVRDTAAIRLSDDEKFIYVSTRTKDVISVIELEDHKPTVIQTVSCGGKHPRDFILLDHYLLCANKNTNEVVSFKINDDGTLGKIVDRIEVPEVVALIQQ